MDGLHKRGAAMANEDITDKQNVPEEWDDGERGECESCGQRRMLQTTIDPFLNEVHEIEEYRTWCRSCWQERKDDI